LWNTMPPKNKFIIVRLSRDGIGAVELPLDGSIPVVYHPDEPAPALPAHEGAEEPTPESPAPPFLPKP
jgi:hypothetical protein